MDKKYIILIALALAAAYYFYNKNKQHHSVDFKLNDTAVYDAWFHYKSTYAKKYQHDEEWYRFSNFKANLEKMGEYYEASQSGEIGYSVGINEYADMDQKEFKEKMLGTKVQKERTNVQALVNSVTDSIDWKQRELSPELKTKANVDLAGHSLPPVHSKVLTTTKLKIYCLSLNNNWLTVREAMETWDAMEV